MGDAGHQHASYLMWSSSKEKKDVSAPLCKDFDGLYVLINASLQLGILQNDLPYVASLTDYLGASVALQTPP